MRALPWTAALTIVRTLAAHPPIPHPRRPPFDPQIPTGATPARRIYPCAWSACRQTCRTSGSRRFQRASRASSRAPPPERRRRAGHCREAHRRARARASPPRGVALPARAARRVLRSGRGGGGGAPSPASLLHPLDRWRPLWPPVPTIAALPTPFPDALPSQSPQPLHAQCAVRASRQAARPAPSLGRLPCLAGPLLAQQPAAAPAHHSAPGCNHPETVSSHRNAISKRLTARMAAVAERPGRSG